MRRRRRRKSRALHLASLTDAEEILSRVQALRGMFLGDDGSPHRDALIVLQDLMKFCHAQQTTACFDDALKLDPLASAQLEGRRQVWLRVSQSLFANDEDLAAVAAEAGGYR